MRPCLILVIVLLCPSCSNSESTFEEDGTSSIEDSYEWILPDEDITGSGIPFPLAMDPALFPISTVDFLDDDSRVAAIRIDDQIRIYPYQYISRFEAVNEQAATMNYAITYCPITKSAIAMNRAFGGNDFVLRASGYLYRDNLILVDQSSGSYWSQMLSQCIKGPFAEEPIQTFNLVELTFEKAKAYFPDARVFTSQSLPEPGKSAKFKKDIEQGELVYGIVDPNQEKKSRAYVFHFDDFGDQPTLKELTVGGHRTIVVGANKDHFISAYHNDSGANFQAVRDRFPIVMKDNAGNLWDVFGLCAEGPRKGDQLESPLGYFALFWAWESFFEEIVLNQ